MNFVAIDVETANSDVASICQIGIATFSNGMLTSEWSSLVNPEDYFHPVNTSIHGIDARHVRGQPTILNIADELRARINGTCCVCHTHFDRLAISRAFKKYKIDPLETSWLDSARVARRAWKQFAWKGYGLKTLCKWIGYEFKPHDALEDAKAAGQIMLAAVRDSQMDLASWMERVMLPINMEGCSPSGRIHRNGNPEGDLFGEVLVFTGALTIRRSEAADLAASIGCQVVPTVSKKTTILVVGGDFADGMSDDCKTSKHRKVEHLISEGHPIRIIREADFRALAQQIQVVGL